MKRTVAVLSAAILTLTACGSDDSGGGGGGDSSDETAAKENIKAEFLSEEGGFTGTDITDEQAGCMSDGLVDEVGTDQLVEYGLLDENMETVEAPDNLKMEAGDADAFAGVVTDCVDMTEIVTQQLAGQDLTPEQEECVQGALDEEAIRGILSATFQGQEPDMEGAMGEAMACVMGEGMQLPDDGTE